MMINPPSSAAFLLLLLTPLAYPGFFPHDVNILTACAGSLLLSLAIMFEQRRSIVLPTQLLTVILALFAIQLWLYGSDHLLSVSTWKLQTTLYASAALLFTLAISIPASNLKWLLQLYLLAASLWAVIGLYVWLGGTQGQALKIGSVTLALAPAIKLAGPFNQGNIFAGLIGFALIFSHWLAWKERKIYYAIAIAFFTAMLFDTLSRGEWLAYLVTATALFIALRPSRAEALRCFIIPWLFGISAGLILTHFSQPSLAGTDGISGLVSSAGASMEERLTIWATALSIFLQAPFVGSGWGQYAPQSWLAAPAASDLMNHLGLSHNLANTYFSAHNLFLHLMAEGGLTMLLPVLWGIWRLLKTTCRLIRRPHNIRICFALAATSFIIQSQVNITFTKPLPLLLTAFFAGIAMAPALRRNSRRLHATSPILASAAIITAVFILWATPVVIQWFAAERALYSFDINNQESAKKLANFANTPRTGAIPSIWIAYNVATTGSHSGLLQWVIPPLRAATHDLPLVATYQVLFYSLGGTGALQEACRVGRIIEAQHFVNEKNNQAYQDVCNGKPLEHYHFGMH
ncbi:O-antigen ligase family protein [Mariprofundus ferrooxydans]|uniref:O-antigen ligase family protein n=1 Tax=Mariprofundus ferrooxydans TaxID=314344 RepID=UPI000378FC84|nr:O-antigen ligase family protein [Mariprofundus ferrooxydans]